MSKQLAKQKRFEIFKRDGFACRYCGQKPPDAMLQVDHVIPQSQGGSDDDEKLVTSCAACNLGKRDGDLAMLMPGASVEEKSQRIQEMRQYQELQRQQEVVVREGLDIIAKRWATLDGKPTDYAELALPRGFERACRRFLRLLDIGEILEAAEIAFARMNHCHHRKLFRYFCGVCWYKVSDHSKAIQSDVHQTL